MIIEQNLTNRRRFIKQIGSAGALAIAAPVVVASKALGDGETPPASERITVGFERFQQLENLRTRCIRFA